MAEKTYKVGSNVYDIPETDVQTFLIDFPDAVEIESFIVDKDTFDIPITERDSFLKDFPTAQPVKKKEVSEVGGVSANVSSQVSSTEQPPLTSEQTPPTETKPKAKTFSDYVGAFAGTVDEGLAGIIEGIDYLGTLTQDAVYQIAFGKETASEVSKMRKEGTLLQQPPALNPPRLTETISQAIRYAGRHKELPKDTKTQRITSGIIEGTASVIPDIVATFVVPEIKLPSLFQRIGLKQLSKFGTVIGTEEAIGAMQTAESGTTAQKIATPLLSGLEGFATGMTFDALGGISSKIGTKIANKIIPETKTITKVLDKALLQHSATSLTNATFFGGYGNLEEYLTTGEISGETFATNAGMGLALGIRETGKLLYAKGIHSLLATPREVLNKTINSKVTSEELAKQAQEKIDNIESGQSTDREGDAISAKILANASILKATVDEVNKNPDEVKESITESELEPKLQETIIDKIDEIVADNDPKVQEAKKYTDDIALIDDALDKIRKNKSWSDGRKEAESRPLKIKKEELKKKELEVYGIKEPEPKEGEGEKKKEPTLTKEEKEKVDNILKKEETKVKEDVKDAERIRRETEEAGSEAQGVVEGEEGRLRVRDTAENGVEAEQGKIESDLSIESITDRAIKYGIIDRDRGTDVLDLIGNYDIWAKEDAKFKEVVDKIPKEEWEQLKNDAYALRNNEPRVMTGPTMEEAIAEEPAKVEEVPTEVKEEVPKTLFHSSATGVESIPENAVINELGIHLGSKTTADKLSTAKGGITREYEVDLKNPIKVDDFARWEAFTVSRRLLNDGVISQKEYNAVNKKTGNDKEKELIRILKSKGYDGFVYDNYFEGGGKSYVVFDKSQIKPITKEEAPQELSPTKQVEEKPPKVEQKPIEPISKPVEPLSTTEGVTAPPKAEEAKKGIKFKDKVYTSIEKVQDDFYDKKITFEENVELLEKVGKFEDGLKADAAKLSLEIASKIGITSKESEEKALKGFKKVQDKLNVKFMVDIPAMANDIFYKPLVKMRDGLGDVIAKLLQSGMKSQIDVLRWPSKIITNWFGGLGRTQFDIHGRAGKIGKLEMKGRVNVFAKYEAQQVREKMLEVVNADHESLERVGSALDPELATETITFDDLTLAEKNLYNLVKDWNTWVWSTNYALGIIPTESHLKFMDTEGKSNYIARMYDKYEIELMPPEIEDHIKKGNSSSVTIRMITDYLNARKEVTEQMKEHAIKDPTYLTSKRIMQTIQNVAVKEYMDAIISEHPDFVKTLKKGEEVPKGYTKLGNSWAWGIFKDKAVINHVVEDFTGFFYASKLTNLSYDFIKLWDRNKINQFYKKFRTLYNPLVQVGNMTGNVFFASINGINPAEFIAEQANVIRDRKNKSDEVIYKAVLKSGLIGDVAMTGEMMPPKETIKDITKEKTILQKTKNILNKGDEFASNLYVGVDNVAKYAAYRIFRKRGFTHEQAIRRAYDAFQNYTTVGKTWDFASKIPVVGPTFVKFQADLQRIITNAILTTPLTAIGTVMLIKLLGNLASNLSGESDDEKEERERRKGVAKIPIVNVPLSFKIGKAELNGARYLAPLYVYRQEDSDADFAELSKYLPLQFQKAPKAQVGEKQNVIAFSDATWGWVGSVMVDRDFRSISIRNPKATIFFNPNLSVDQRRANVLNYVLRSQLPFYKSFEDIADGMTGRLDYYDRKRSWYQAIMNGIVKIQEFDKPELKRYMEGNIEYLTNKFAGLSKAQGDANILFLREIQKAKDLGMSEKAFNKLYETEDKRRTKNMQKSIEEQIPILQEIERLSVVYKKWYPQDDFVKNNFMDIEAGKNKIFDIQSDIDLQKKYEEEYNLLKKNGLLRKPDEIPAYYDKKKLTEEQRKTWTATYWSEYIRQLDTTVGLTQEDIDKNRAIVEDTEKDVTKPEPKKVTKLDRKITKSRTEARKKANQWLDQEMAKVKK